MFAFNKNANASSIIYQDNFNSDTNGSFPSGWSLGIHNNCPEQWQASGGEAGLNIQNTACISNIYPDDAHWTNSLGNNYSLELDANFISGTDHNIAFWYDKNLDVASELHFQSPGDFSIAAPIDHYTTNVSQGYPNGQTYHIKVVVNNLTMQVYINGTLVRDAVLYQQLPSTGRIALRATSGTDSSSNTNFDNVVVTKFDNDLAVPVFKQTDPLWATDVYDGANNWSPTSPTVSRWGCALTSAAMILKYYGYNLLPDGSQLNPGTLNSWLKNFKSNGIGLGYVNGIDTGYLNWAVISQISKLAKNINNITDKDALQLSLPPANSSQLASDISNNIPDILQVNPPTGMHYVVAKGVNGSTFDINDPAFNFNDLQSGYGNPFSKIIKYQPSFTDLSYIVFAVNPDVSLNLSDGTNQNLGSELMENPFADPNGTQTTGQKSMRFIYLPIPQSGNYNLTVSGNSGYHLNEFFYDQSGNATASEQYGVVSQGNPETINISYNNQNANGSSSEKNTTFQSTREDIDEAKALSLINSSGALLSSLNSSEKYYLAGDFPSAIDRLNLFIKHLDTQRGKGITETAYQTLVYDANHLISFLQGLI